MSNNRSFINARKRKAHLPEIEQFLQDADLSYSFIHGFEWHIRVENVVDIFPTNKKYHILSNDARGQFKDYEELGQIFIDAMEINKEGN
jgi:hypothetical protein